MILLFCCNYNLETELLKCLPNTYRGMLLFLSCPPSTLCTKNGSENFCLGFAFHRKLKLNFVGGRNEEFAFPAARLTCPAYSLPPARIE